MSRAAGQNPSPRPPPRSPEGEKNDLFPPLRFGEGGRGEGSCGENEMAWRLLAALWALVLVSADKGPAKRFSPEEVAFFEKDVRPLLTQHCYKCHGEGKVRGGLRLTSRDGVLAGGDLGPAVDLNKPEASRLLQALHYKGDLDMPPTGKLPAKDIEVFTRWVKMGLPWTPGSATTVQTPAHKGGVITPESKNYWAYRPVQRPPLPEVKDAAWVKSAVDAFVLARLEARGLKPAAPADRVALIRRATYDLAGLPPT